MRKTESAYSQTFCIVEFSPNHLSGGRFWKIKLPLHCCSSLAGMSHALSTHSRSPGMAGSLCQESIPPSQPAAFRLPFGLVASSACAAFLASLRRRGGVFSWVPCLSVHSCKPQYTPAALKHLWTSWIILSYPILYWILYWTCIGFCIE